jgi:lipoprotein-anchoring transpeptidase ErfK/SrfK/transposase-like protein
MFRRAVPAAAMLIGLAAPWDHSFAQYYRPYSYPAAQGAPNRAVPPVDPDGEFDDARATRNGAAGSARGDPRSLAALPPEVRPETGPKKELPPQFRRTLVDYSTKEPAGTIIVDTPNTYLYFVLGGGKALRYGIGVGREGFTWTGAERVSRMAEWPDWNPPEQMIERQPYLPRFMAGGDGNPLGARALYLGNTLYRIHGTNQPSTIGSFVSSGCIRLTNEDITDLYARVKIGSRVVVLRGRSQVAAAAAPVASYAGELAATPSHAPSTADVPRRRDKPEEILAKLRQVDALIAQGQSLANAVRQIGVTESTYHRWRQEFGVSKSERAKRPKEAAHEVPKSVSQNEVNVVRDNVLHSTAFEE